MALHVCISDHSATTHQQQVTPWAQFPSNYCSQIVGICVRQWILKPMIFVDVEKCYSRTVKSSMAPDSKQVD